ncbi:M23 family metallopeptidase [Mycolicibacterium sp.]|uniref:M23 family metallopeptidase n=1 Tax=Mycolicibacterium sp. TaxID=2320850 RepID=UPI00355D1A41
MDTPASIVLILLGIIAFQRSAEGNLGQWLRAKFLNSADGFGLTAVATDVDASTAPGGSADAVPVSLGGAWSFPVPGHSIGNRGHGVQTHPVYGDQRMHHGVDIGAPYGTPIVAARPGKVTYVGASGGYGLRVDVDHGQGVVTRYAHLSSIDVVLGQIVDAAQRLGLVGSTGTSTAPHLHFEVRRDGRSIDPAPLFSAASTYGVA